MTISKKFPAYLFGVVGCISLTGCASIIDEETQIVNVDTPYCPGAECILENDNGKFIVKSTPETVTIHKSSEDLMVSCSKDGHSHAETFESSANAAMWGNLIFGGIIGAVIDWQDAGFDYEAIIANPLRCGNIEAEKAVAEKEKAALEKAKESE